MTDSGAGVGDGIRVPEHDSPKAVFDAKDRCTAKREPCRLIAAADLGLAVLDFVNAGKPVRDEHRQAFESE